MFKGLQVLTVVTIMVLIMAAGAAAQEGPRGLWWRSPEIAGGLQLGNDEIQQLERAFDASRLRMIDLKSRVEAEQAKLQALLERRSLDEAAVNAQHQALEQARTALANERFAFFVEVRKIIGHDRFQQLLEMQKTVPRDRRRR